jgi:hypothetical protein
MAWIRGQIRVSILQPAQEILQPNGFQGFWIYSDLSRQLFHFVRVAGPVAINAAIMSLDQGKPRPVANRVYLLDRPARRKVIHAGIF